MAAQRIPVEKRFWIRVDQSDGPDACWIWTGGYSSSGYGAIKHNRKQCGTHRIAYELSFGAIPNGMMVCHRCDNRACCNPAHLFLGTAADNLADMAAKNRHPYTKLSPENVRDIRARVASGEIPAHVAREFGVHAKTISQVISRVSFKHVA